MSKKDFELIANAIAHNARLARSTVEQMAIRDVALTFAADLARTNPRFARERFLIACEVAE